MESVGLESTVDQWLLDDIATAPCHPLVVQAVIQSLSRQAVISEPTEYPSRDDGMTGQYAQAGVGLEHLQIANDM